MPEDVRVSHPCPELPPPALLCFAVSETAFFFCFTPPCLLHHHRIGSLSPSTKSIACLRHNPLITPVISTSSRIWQFVWSDLFHVSRLRGSVPEPDKR